MEEDGLPPPSLVMLSTALTALGLGGTPVSNIDDSSDETTAGAAEAARVWCEPSEEKTANSALIVHCICDFFVDL
uniref:Uncharacterized protein n=1 Tax=Anopheles darlingi TaxID=43151 RepID=A0A2M4CJI9_ANODA